MFIVHEKNNWKKILDMLQIVNKETQSLLLTDFTSYFRVSVRFFLVQWFSVIQKIAMVILYLPQQTNTCPKSATKTLEITEDNSNENLFKN